MNNLERDVFIHYLVIQLSLKHSFEFFDLSLPNEMLGRGKPDIIVGQIGIKSHWKSIIPKTFEELKTETGMYNFKWYQDLYEQHCRIVNIS